MYIGTRSIYFYIPDSFSYEFFEIDYSISCVIQVFYIIYFYRKSNSRIARRIFYKKNRDLRWVCGHIFLEKNAV